MSKSKTVAQAKMEQTFNEGIMLELALRRGELNENKVTVGASITPSERAQLDALATVTGLKSSALIRAAVRRIIREASEAGILPTESA